MVVSLCGCCFLRVLTFALTAEFFSVCWYVALSYFCASRCGSPHPQLRLPYGSARLPFDSGGLVGIPGLALYPTTIRTIRARACFCWYVCVYTYTLRCVCCWFKRVVRVKHCVPHLRSYFNTAPFLPKTIDSCCCFYYSFFVDILVLFSPFYGRFAVILASVCLTEVVSYVLCWCRVSYSCRIIMDDDVLYSWSPIFLKSRPCPQNRVQ